MHPFVDIFSPFCDIIATWGDIAVECCSWSRLGRDGPYCVNRYRIEGGFRYPRHYHEDHWEFVYVCEGEFRHEIGERRIVHGEGLLLLIRDADVHALRGERFSYVNLAFRPEWLDRLEAFTRQGGLRRRLESAPEPPSCRVDHEDRPVLEKRFDELLRRAEAEDAALRFSQVLSDLVLRCLPSTGNLQEPSAAEGVYAASEPAASLPPWLSQLMEWAERAEEIPSPREFCAKSGYTREHVIRTMGRTAGLTPAAFLEDLRLRRAEDLLRFTNYPIGRVAAETSWTSLRQFQRVYRSRRGRSPGAYRRELSRLAH